MTSDHLLGLIVFGGITAFTPGPNNTLLLASGINFGFKRTVPMIVGVCLGFPLMIACVGFGLGKVFETYPLIYVTMKYLGVAYMLWLAWNIAISKPALEGGTVSGHPMTFLQTAAFQWINPKAWVMAVTALSAYTVANDYNSGVVAVVATFIVMGATSATTWALFGLGLKHTLNDARYYRAINIVLALSLVASLVPMVLH